MAQRSEEPRDNSDATRSPSAMFRTGETIDGRYRVVREVGRGGYGTVYLAEELDSTDVLGWSRDAESLSPAVLRPVAVKVLDPRRHDRKRFASEVRALCRLSHPAIVTVYGYGRAVAPGITPGNESGATWVELVEGSPECPYLAMEMIEGEPLSAWMGSRSRQSFQRVLGILIHVAEALGHAHARGVVHRDLKPHNVLVGTDGIPRVVDFGLSWLLRNEDPASQQVGTPGYLAPELLASGEPTRDHRVDIYGFGATAFALFAGRSPFKSKGLYATVKAQLTGVFEFPEEFPAPLRSLVRRCLSRDPMDRPRAAALVAEELRRIAAAPGIVVGGADDGGIDSESGLAARTDVRDAAVVEVSRFDHPTRGPGVKFELAGGDPADGATIRGFAYGDRAGTSARRIHDVLTWAWEGAEVSIYGARAVSDSSGRRFLAADGSTVPVLEPYFPVAVTDVARADGVRCGACATRVLVDARRPSDPGRNLVAGSLAHDMLERMVRAGGEVDFDAAFDESFATMRMDALAAGLADADVDRMRADLRGHFVNLARWTADDTTRKGRRAEVKRFSSRYGLEGRIDLSVVDDQVTRILELKTGRHENPEHERQLRCYTLMWDAIAERRGHRVEGHLLYSKTGKQKPLLRRSHESEREVVVARNDVVAMHRWFSDGDTAYRPPSHGDQPALCADSPCRFRRDECRFQTALLGSIAGDLPHPPIDDEVWGDVDPRVVRAARAYYFHFLGLIEREYRAASLAMGAVFRAATVADRAERLRAVLDARLASTSAATGQVVFECDAWGVFDEGDEVIAHRGDFDAEPCLSGKVVSRSADSLTIRCEGAEEAETLPEEGWVLDRDILRVGFRAMHRALYRFVLARDPRRLERVVLPGLRSVDGQRALELHDGAPEEAVPVAGSSGRELNTAQLEAISQALRGHDAFLIHGPPGTGKTTVIAELVERLVAEGKRVLVAACTHTAVDTVLSRVVATGVTDVLRVGWPRSGSGDLRRAMLDAGLRPAMHHTATLGQAADSLERLQHRVVSASVVAATTNACVTDPTFGVIARRHAESGLDGPAFDVAIVDEASQLTEPLALAAINLASRFILVGDDQQLPPVVTAPDAATGTTAALTGVLEDSGLGGLDVSLFARLRPFVPHVVLTTQYRMNAEVQAVPNRAFYGRKLVAGVIAANRRLELAEDAVERVDADLWRRLDPGRPTVWVDVGEGALRRVHPVEVEEVVRTVAALLDVWPEGRLGIGSVGVVSPFRAQCHAIRVALREALGAERADLVEVDTVDRFQGREKEVMLVSLVVDRWSDFVMNPNRLNVTLTRARSKVIVFGSRAVRERLDQALGNEDGEDSSAFDHGAADRGEADSSDRGQSSGDPSAVSST